MLQCSSPDNPSTPNAYLRDRVQDGICGAFLGQLSAWCEHHAIPYQGVPVGTIKKHATGKSDAGKADMIGALRARGFQPVDDNEADALALLGWALAQEGVA